MASADILFFGFYQLMQEKTVRVKTFAARWEGSLNWLWVIFLHMVTKSDQGHQLKERMIYCMHKSLCNSVWYLYDNTVNYTLLLVVARCIESEAVDSKGKTAVTQKSTVVGDTWETSELESLKQQVATLKSMIMKDPKKMGNNGTI